MIKDTVQRGINHELKYNYDFPSMLYLEIINMVEFKVRDVIDDQIRKSILTEL